MFWISLSIVASVLTAFQLVPQTVKTVKTKNFSGVSLPTFSMILTTSALWLAYGIHLQDVAIIFANVLSLLCAMVIIGMKLVYRKK